VTRHFFNTRPPKDGRPAYLVWKHPFRHTEIRRQLLPALGQWQRQYGRDDEPKQISIGDYVVQEDGRVGFVPRSSNPLALATLYVEAVQRRIAEDLAIQNSSAEPGNGLDC